jgi:hypothetical protein
MPSEHGRILRNLLDAEVLRPAAARHRASDPSPAIRSLVNTAEVFDWNPDLSGPRG